MKNARFLLLAAVFTSSLFAQQPSFRGGTITTAHAAGDLARQIANLGAGVDKVWVGYSIPLLRRHHVEMCCNNSNCGVCMLDSSNWSTTIIDSDDQPVTGRAAIFYEVRNGAIERI